MAVITSRDLASRKGASSPGDAPVRVAEVPLPAKQVTRMRDVANPTPTNVYRLQHPELTDQTSMFDSEITVNGTKLTMKKGRIETEDEAICKTLVRMGYRWMNEPF
jgi:hypothetical protein